MIIIGGNQAVCPKGYICVNNYNLLIILFSYYSWTIYVK